MIRLYQNWLSVVVAIGLSAIGIQTKQLAFDVAQTMPANIDSVEFRQSFEARYIPSGAMIPTLQINDKILVDKHSYQTQAPQRGDIVLFRPTPALVAQNFKDVFIKRVIGLPGETVQVKSNKVYINGKALSENYLAEPPDYEYGPVTIPNNAYFVLGDNRNNSYDSHYWGFVARAYIFGKAIGIYCPVERQQVLDKAQPLSAKNQQMLSFMQQVFQQNPTMCQLPEINRSAISQSFKYYLNGLIK